MVGSDRAVRSGGNCLCLRRSAQVLSNLLSNAQKFTDEGGVISVFAQCRADRGSVVIGVRDTGCGIAEHDLPHIFDRLYQADAHADSMSSRGLGLGLSIAREIVTLHGGEVQVESELGRGSVFRVVLPLEMPLVEDGDVTVAVDR